MRAFFISEASLLIKTFNLERNPHCPLHKPTSMIRTISTETDQPAIHN
mgnify:CR=1 FL=1